MSVKPFVDSAAGNSRVSCGSSDLFCVVREARVVFALNLSDCLTKQTTVLERRPPIRTACDTCRPSLVVTA